MEMTARASGGADSTNVHDFLFKLVSERCSSLSSSSQSKLSLYCTLNSWNRYSSNFQADCMCSCQLQTLKAACVCHRVLLALPALLFMDIKTEGGRTILQFSKMIKHVNQHQVSCWLELRI